MGNLTVRAMVMCAFVAACGGEEARPDPTSNQGGAEPTSATSTAATNATSATTDAASSAQATTDTSTGSTMMGEEVDGTRIKIRYLVGDDGMKSKVGYFDSQLGVECSFADVGGETRCVPLSARPANLLFADAACTIPVVLLDCHDPPATHAREPSGCGAPVFHELGAEISTIYAQGGMCAVSPIPSGGKAYPLGAEVPVNAFARATIQ